MPTTKTVTCKNIRLAQITDEPLDLNVHLAAVQQPAMGAVATFIGQVRDHDPEADGTVTKLSYSHHPDAQQFLDRCLVDVIAPYRDKPHLTIAASHRVGDLAVGDAALIVAVASPHRDLAFDVCPLVVNAIKANVPIWKQQHTACGHTAWSGIDCC